MFQLKQYLFAFPSLKKSRP